MQPEQIYIDFGRNEVYECGAALLSVLAHATADDSKARVADTHASLCGRGLLLQYAMNPDDWSPINVRLPYAFRDRDVIERDTTFAANRLQERLVAGRMAIPFLQRAALGPDFRLPPKLKRLSVNQMAEFALADAEQSDPSNLKSRYWVPSQPVIHLAAAAVVVGQELLRSGEILRVESLLTWPALIKTIVRRAELFEDLIVRDPEFPVKSEKLVRVRLV